MNFSDAPPFRDLGNIVSIGVIMAFFYSILFLPSLMAVLPVRVKAKAQTKHNYLGGLAGFIIRRRRVVFWGVLALIVVMTAGISQIELNDQFMKYFSESYEIRRATDFLEKNLMGYDIIEYSLEAGETGGINDPEYLATVEAFANWYRQQPKVVHVDAITNTMKRLNRDMNGADESYYRIPEQTKRGASFSFQPEYYHEWENGSSFTFAPFFRGDSADSERSHFDIRELNYLWLGDSWELRVGIGKVFWGTTEFAHLADIINQTDTVESYDGEDKLGQPMVHLSLPRDWGIIDLFAMPYFRERTFPGSKGRLRSPLVVDTDNPEYESGSKQRHLDLALRYSHTIGDWDFGIYHFYGTGREPTLRLGANGDGGPVLIPFYELINQTGVDVQLIAGEWLLKLETLYRTGQGDDFFAAVGGFEYSLTGIAGSDMDVSIIGELAYDSRDEDATMPYEHDIMLGLRFALNDPADSALLAGVMQDVTSSARILSVEASRRIRSSWKVNLEARFFFDSSQDDLLHSMRDDDFLRLELAYHF